MIISAFSKYLQNGDLENIANYLAADHSKQSIEIYRNNIQQNLLNSLQNTFPKSLELISDDAFTYLAKKYIAANPATSLDLNNYGLEFPEFLKTLAEINKAPYLPEFALSELYLAKAEDFKLNKLRANINLANIDLEKIKISLNPGSYLLKTKCDIYSIHQLTNKKSTKEIKQQQNQYFSIIYSSRDAVAIGNLSNDEYHILNNIKNNKPQNLTKKQILKLEDFLTIKFEI